MRLLDTFGASAQSSVEEGTLFYAWGQHIYDDFGDNTGQFGVHGTAQAVIGLATGLIVAGPNSRHLRYLEGGVRWLTRSLTKPKKQIDLRKTVKMAELATAICGCQNHTDRENALIILRAGRNPDSGAWGFDLADMHQVSIVPTLFALRALVQCHELRHDRVEEIVMAARFCLDNLPHNSQEDKRRACIYMLARSMAQCRDLAGIDVTLLNDIFALLKSDEPATIPLLHVTTFDYRIRANGLEATAFCTIQTGLLQVWLYLWAREAHIELKTPAQQQIATITELSTLLSTTLPFSLVESCSVAIQICVAFRTVLDNVAMGTVNATDITAIDAAKAVDPLEQPKERENLYLELMAQEKFKNVRIVKSLSGGWSDAYLDLCEITDSTDSTMAPQVLKLATKADAEREVRGARDAANYIDRMHRVDVLAEYSDENKPHGLIRFDYAGGKLRRGGVIPFLYFLDSAGNVAEVVTALDEHFRVGLGKLYENRRPKSSSLSQLRQFFEDARGGTFWSTITEGLRDLMSRGLVQGYEKRQPRLFVEIPFAIITNIFHDSPKFTDAWKTSFHSMETPKGHGDHNPRNLLMVQEKKGERFRPVLIDFHRFGGALPLALDFARLEVGVQVKSLRDTIGQAIGDEETAAHLRSYEKIVHGKLDFTGDLGSTSVGFSGCPILARMAQVKAAIRKSFLGVAGAAQDYTESYFAVLLLCYLSYLRPFYRDKLTPEQRTYALYSAAQIFEIHFLQN